MHRALPHLPSLLSRSRPVHLTFFATRRCNARCPFCFYGKAMDAEGAPPELSLDEIRSVARSMGPLLWVLFSGGEPFLREDLAPASAAFHDLNRAVFLTFPTNGLLPEVVAERTAEILRLCPESVVVVKVSLDGVGAEHDAIRGVPGGFERALRTLERLAALARRHRRLEIGVNTLFCSENQRRMAGIVDLVRGLDGVRSHTISMVRGDLRDPRWREVDLAEYQRATAHLERAWSFGPRRLQRFAGAGLKAAQDRLRHRLVRRTLAEGRRVLPCQAGRLNLVLTESGELHPCEERWDLSFGNVRDAGHDVAAMLGSERGRRIRHEVEHGACACSHECNLLVNALASPAAHPRLLAEWARIALPRRGRTGAPGPVAEGCRAPASG